MSKNKQIKKVKYLFASVMTFFPLISILSCTNQKQIKEEETKKIILQIRNQIFQIPNQN
ncbi:Uncharacterised protein [Metamycoplasma alkalescens]|uniref:Lipoprotein n=1 Tax=Metamycoplasma alkalescens TaxID=45363 RepID=A0A3B0NZG2_9BACT|nr:Uncharacterised protein [Metamycoplasma alkalescens]